MENVSTLKLHREISNSSLQYKYFLKYESEYVFNELGKNLMQFLADTPKDKFLISFKKCTEELNDKIMIDYYLFIEKVQEKVVIFEQKVEQKEEKKKSWWLNLLLKIKSVFKKFLKR